MRRTHLTTVLAFVLGGLVIGYLGELALIGTGSAALVPPLTLPITLALIAVVVVAFAWPIRRAVQGRSKGRVDPFRAMRTAVLAKACTMVGAFVLGAGLGIAGFLVTRSVLPAASTIWLAIGTAIGAAVLLAGGLVAEWCCTLPPPTDPELDDEDRARAR